MFSSPFKKRIPFCNTLAQFRSLMKLLVLRRVLCLGVWATYLGFLKSPLSRLDALGYMRRLVAAVVFGLFIVFIRGGKLSRKLNSCRLGDNSS